MNSGNNIYSFFGRSSAGMREFSILTKLEAVRRFWARFGAECQDLDNIIPSVLRSFYGLAVKDQPSAMLLNWGDNFLITQESLREWFLYWKGVELPFQKYVKERLLYTAVYAVRYCIDQHKEECSLAPLFVSVIRGKEFATFLQNGWTGTGVIGIAGTSDGSRTVIREFHFRNMMLSHIYCDYYECGIASVRTSEFNAFADEFEESLGDYSQGIKSYADFSENTLLQQTRYFCTRYLSEPGKSRKALRHIVGFYRFLLTKEEGGRIFDDGNFSPSLLKCMTVLRYLSEGWEFIDYKTIGEKESRRRLVVVIKDMREFSTRFGNGDAIAVDLSQIESEYYRNIIWRYFRSNKSFLTRVSCINHIAEALHLIEPTKRGTGKITIFTDADARQIQATILEKSIQDQTVIQIFGELRNFFIWTNNNGLITAQSDYTIECLAYHAEGIYTRTKQQAIPRQDADRILGRMSMEAERSYRGAVMFTIVALLASTCFRPSQICCMNVQSITLCIEDGYCTIRGVTKISKGDKSESIAHPQAYNWLTDIIGRSAEMRERCYDRDVNDKVFLLDGDTGFRVVKESDVKEEIARVCDILELPRWTPYSFRKMYATVWDELDRSLGYHGELAAQGMGHSSYKTTRDHYIDRTFEEFQRMDGAELISSDEMMLQEYEQFLKDGRI